MLPVLDKLDARRVTTVGCLLLALSLVANVALNLALNGLQQSEVLARIPSLVIQVVSYVLAACEHVGALLVALGLAARLSRRRQAPAPTEVDSSIRPSSPEGD